MEMQRSAPTRKEIAPGQLLIGGQWVDSASGETMDVIDPTTEAAITQVQKATRTTPSGPSMRQLPRSKTVHGARVFSAFQPGLYIGATLAAVVVGFAAARAGLAAASLGFVAVVIALAVIALLWVCRDPSPALSA